MPSGNPNSFKANLRISLIGNPEQRTGSTINKDQQFINFYPEIDVIPALHWNQSVDGGRSYKIEQRGGLVYSLSTTTGTGRGIYYWQSHVFSVVGSTLYKDSTSLQTLSTSTGKVGFVEMEDSTTNTKWLIVLDGTSGWIITTAFAISQITNVNFPTPHSTQAATLDGYLFVAKSGTGDIYNCDLNTPSSWTAGSFISAEQYPDDVVGVVRQNNYIVAIGQQTVEYFYDAGNAPGTPLARNQAGIHQAGTPAQGTIAVCEDQVAFVGQTQRGGRCVFVLDGFNIQDVSLDVIQKSLDNEGTHISNAVGYIIRTKGRKFYVLQITSLTWVYDFQSNMWHKWADNTGAGNFPCGYGHDSGNGKPYMLDNTTGYVYQMTDGVSTDATGVATVANITSIVYTQRFDFSTMNNKFLHRLSLVCDVPDNGSASSIDIVWSDDDYNTWSTTRTLQLTDAKNSMTQLGRFRRRAFKFTYAQPYPIRIEGIEVDINLGVQ